MGSDDLHKKKSTVKTRRQKQKNARHHYAKYFQALKLT
jgi:hypothetical protein